MVLFQVIEEHDQNLDKKLNILEYRGFLEEEVRVEQMMTRARVLRVVKVTHGWSVIHT